MAAAAQLEAAVKQMQAEGLLDDQFQQLLALQDEANPDFVAEVVQLYFQDGAGKIERVQQLLLLAGSSSQPDYNELDQLVHQFKGSSASLGATAVAQLCIKLREACQARNAPACQQLVQQIREAFVALQARLEAFLALERQHKAGG